MFKAIGKGLGKILLLVFGICVFGLMVMLTFGSLGRIFPNDSVKQISGLILFDAGALVWIIIFVGASRGVMQRAISFLLFLFCVLGAVVMAGADALMSGQGFVEVPQWVGQATVYLFIIATAVNLIALYFHHLMNPELTKHIRMEAQEDALIAKGIDQAEAMLDKEAAGLAEVLAGRYRENALLALDLGDHVSGAGIIDAKAHDVPENVIHLPPTDWAEPMDPTQPAKTRRNTSKQ